MLSSSHMTLILSQREGGADFRRSREATSIGRETSSAGKDTSDFSVFSASLEFTHIQFLKSHTFSVDALPSEEMNLHLKSAALRFGWVSVASAL